MICFFFQAEDGIRDIGVTGVQTCALPISDGAPSAGKQSYADHKEQPKRARKAEKAVKECEDRIARFEARKAEIDRLLCKPENASNMELITEYTELMKQLDKANEEWFGLSEALEEFAKQ